VPALVERVVVDQFGIRPLCPAPLVRKDAHGNRDSGTDALDNEEPVSTRDREPAGAYGSALTIQEGSRLVNRLPAPRRLEV
jgi:hypothetical protein